MSAHTSLAKGIVEAQQHTCAAVLLSELQKAHVDVVSQGQFLADSFPAVNILLCTRSYMQITYDPLQAIWLRFPYWQFGILSKPLNDPCY
jgi:hypothetical protein